MDDVDLLEELVFTFGVELDALDEERDFVGVLRLVEDLDAVDLLEEDR